MNKCTIINLVLAAKLPCYNYPHAFVFELNNTVHECFELDGKFIEELWDDLTLAEYHADWERVCNAKYEEPLCLKHIFYEDATKVAVLCAKVHYFQKSGAKNKLYQLSAIADNHGAHIEWCGLDTTAPQSDKFIITHNSNRYLVTVDALRYDRADARLQSI